MSDSTFKIDPNILFKIDKNWRYHKLPKEEILIPLDNVPELNEDGESHSDNPGQLLRHKRLTFRERADLFTDIDLKYFGLEEGILEGY